MRFYLWNFVFLFIASFSSIHGQDNPVANKNDIFEEAGGFLAVEAEHFYKQTQTDNRKWYRQNANEKPKKIWADPDGPHLAQASNFSYIEALPDTRTTHGDELINGVNFSNEPGVLATVHYRVKINTPGRYYVWVRAYSTGSEDNGIHVGIDEQWPEHGKRMQWCEGKNQWTWASKQRTKEKHCGVPHEIYLDIQEAGLHDIQFSIREDGFEFDKFILTTNKDFVPRERDNQMTAVSTIRPPLFFPQVLEDPSPKADLFKTVLSVKQGVKLMRATNFPIEQSNYYINKNWLAINPNKAKEAKASQTFNFKSDNYDIVFLGVGENDGRSTYEIQINGEHIGTFTAPLSDHSFEEGLAFAELFEGKEINKGDEITILAKIGSEDGQEYSRARWAGLVFAPNSKGKDVLSKLKSFSYQENVGSAPVVTAPSDHAMNPATQLVQTSMSTPIEREPPGDGSIEITGELKAWHKITLTMDGPFAHELDKEPNPFIDYQMTVTFSHESGSPSYQVPGYFAADGKAAETSADKGIKWRAHLAPDKVGKWTYEISFKRGEYLAVLDVPWAKEVVPYHGQKGSFVVEKSNISGRDFRSKGRLNYVGKHYLQFQGDQSYFFKAGTDAPETLLAYEDFDGTYTVKTPLKKYNTHVKDWAAGDPTWKDGKGKGLIGALNYLASKGVNAFSFLTYNAGGDGDNVWPFVERNNKYHYDCSKLDQWQIVFEHAQSKGLYLHFKMQEQENDDNKKGRKKNGNVIIESLDGGDLGPQRKLYIRELIARFGYNLALNWNLGEENTQTTEQRRAMAAYIQELDPYLHNTVLHTFPNQQEKVYPVLLGDQSKLTGFSLQNHWNQTHKRTLQWVKASAEAGKPLVIANDEQGNAGQGVPPDPGYENFDASKLDYDLHDIRKQTLWGNLMAGGAGVEYYFGYKLPQNDILAEDFRSRDQSWEYCKVAIDFFQTSGLPFEEMKNHNELIGNTDMSKDKYCLAKGGEVYLVYLGYTETSTLDLTGVSGEFSIRWFNPRTGGQLEIGTIKTVDSGGEVKLGFPPSEKGEDWLVIIKKT